MDKIDIDLMGRQYSVSVKADEKETLLAAVTLVDERMRKLANKSTSGGETLALMAALDIANEFVTHQRAGGLDLPDYRRRINLLGERFEQALAKQEKLF
ncbi:MAG: cell division protein ZapA [Rhodocyclales bacterium]|nr:cell division protein ZapA [Rhodocyclales bacterium]